jgi:hypothetical protein
MADSYKREIAKIERTHLGFEDHGVMTGFLHVNYGGAGQGVGGYSISTAAGPYIERTLKACGVNTWEELCGRTIYVLTNSDRRVMGIENLPTEPGEQFLFSDVFGEY